MIRMAIETVALAAFVSVGLYWAAVIAAAH